MNKEKLRAFLQRLSEPSSKVGMAVLFALCGAPAGLPEVVSITASAALAIWGVFTPEQGNK